MRPDFFHIPRAARAGHAKTCPGRASAPTRPRGRPAGAPAPAGLPPSSQAGASLIEFSIVAIPLLLAGLGSVEIAQWHYVRQVVSLALAQAARAGSTAHASPQAMETAFERALSPLFPAAAASTMARMRGEFARRERQTAAPAWRIQVISPSAGAYRDFADGQLEIARQTGHAAINNDYQAEQDGRRRRQGWAGGLGPQSGESIFQANTLVLRATYPHEPIVPGMKALLKILARETTDSYAGQVMSRAGYLPITQELALTMQSHPVNWPLPASGKIVRSTTRSTVPAAQAAAQSCHGLWCPPGPPSIQAWQPSDPSRADPAARHPPGSGAGAPPAESPSAPDQPPDAQAHQPWEDGVAGDPDCGLTLCCAGA